MINFRATAYEPWLLTSSTQISFQNARRPPKNIHVACLVHRIISCTFISLNSQTVQQQLSTKSGDWSPRVYEKNSRQRIYFMSTWLVSFVVGVVSKSHMQVTPASTRTWILYCNSVFKSRVQVWQQWVSGVEWQVRMHSKQLIYWKKMYFLDFCGVN